MSATHPVHIIIIGITVILAAGYTQPAAEQQQTPATSVVNMNVPFEPVPVTSADGTNIAYEPELEPANNMTHTPEKVVVINPATGKTLYAADSDLLGPGAGTGCAAAEITRENKLADCGCCRRRAWLVTDRA